MRRMEKVTGRSDDMIILRGVNLFPTQIEELLLQIEDLSPHFQCVLSRSGTLDEMTVRVEMREPVSIELRDAAGRELAYLIKSNVGVTASCDVGEPGTLARSEGKAKRVIDQR